MHKQDHRQRVAEPVPQVPVGLVVVRPVNPAFGNLLLEVRRPGLDLQCDQLAGRFAVLERLRMRVNPEIGNGLLAESPAPPAELRLRGRLAQGCGGKAIARHRPVLDSRPSELPRGFLTLAPSPPARGTHRQSRTQSNPYHGYAAEQVTFRAERGTGRPPFATGEAQAKGVSFSDAGTSRREAASCRCGCKGGSQMAKFSWLARLVGAGSGQSWDRRSSVTVMRMRWTPASIRARARCRPSS